MVQMNCGAGRTFVALQNILSVALLRGSSSTCGVVNMFGNLCEGSPHHRYNLPCQLHFRSQKTLRVVLKIKGKYKTIWSKRYFIYSRIPCHNPNDWLCKNWTSLWVRWIHLKIPLSAEKKPIFNFVLIFRQTTCRQDELIQSSDKHRQSFGNHLL